MKREIFDKLGIERIFSYHLFILVGFLMAFGTFLKLIGVFDFSSDWLWFLAGIGLVVEGFISLMKQKRFDRKYKIIERDDADKK